MLKEIVKSYFKGVIAFYILFNRPCICATVFEYNTMYKHGVIKNVGFRMRNTVVSDQLHLCSSTVSRVKDYFPKPFLRSLSSAAPLCAHFPPPFQNALNEPGFEEGGN